MKHPVRDNCYLASWFLVVDDLEASLDFYTRLGFEKTASVGIDAWVLRLGEFRLDLWNRSLFDPKVRQDLTYPIASHLLLRVADDAAFSALAEHAHEESLNIMVDRHSDPASRNRMILQDPDGNIVEILQEELYFLEPARSDQ